MWVIDLGTALATSQSLFGIEAVTDGNAGDGCAGLQALMDNLGFERLGIRALMALLRAIATAQ